MGGRKGRGVFSEMRLWIKTLAYHKPKHSAEAPNSVVRYIYICSKDEARASVDKTGSSCRLSFVIVTQTVVEFKLVTIALSLGFDERK